MTFSVKQYVADQELTPFPFEDIDGNQQELPNYMLMTAKQAGVFAEKLELDPLGAFAEIAPDMAEKILATPVAAVGELVKEYMEHCKGNAAGVGEASASPASSKSTARPSKRTSPATTKARTRKR